MGRGKFLKRDVTAITNTDSPYTTTPGIDVLTADPSSGAITVNLHAGNSGDEIVVTGIATGNNITVNPNGAENINGSSSLVISSVGSFQLIHDGSNWFY